MPTPIPVRKPVDPSKATSQKQNEQWTGPGHVITFVRCLRLLNLDNCGDWPGITEQTFSASSAHQNLQQRIKGVEWSLYRLFEIWDPSETKDKLRPFFPPLAPLQSLNLRAALLRALAELKKNGVLGREAVLRKTMLDECKGEKFEEIICAFAMAVLRKHARGRSDPSSRLACADRVPDREKDHLLPLVLAHRDSLQRRIAHRGQTAQQVDTYLTALGRQDTDLKRRRTIVTRNIAGLDAPDQQAFDDVEEITRRSWTGDDRWADIMLNGNPPNRDHLFESTFKESLDVVQDVQNVEHIAPRTVLDDLNERIAKQDSRLRRWKAFQASLQVSEERTKPFTAPTVKEKNPLSLHFNQHRPLVLSATRAKESHDSRQIIPEHEVLLKSMDAELANLRSSRPAKKSTKSPDAHAQSNDISHELLMTSPHSTLRDDRLEEAAEHENNAIFKDVVEDPSPDHARLQLGATNPTPMTPRTKRTGFLQDTDREILLDSPGTKTVKKITAPKFELPVNQGEPLLNRDPDKTSHMLPQEELSAQEVETGDNDRDVLQTPKTTRVPWVPVIREASDTQRLAASSQRGSTTLPDDVTSPSPFESFINSRPIPESAVNLLESPSLLFGVESPPLTQTSKSQAVRGTLLERTRQSMALLPNLNSMQGSPVHSRPRKSISRNKSPTSRRVSTQQSETFRKTTENTDVLENGVALHSPEVETRSPTPRDRLFEEEADYASLFKSRPKIALGPTFSSERSGIGSDTMPGVEGDFEDRRYRSMETSGLPLGGR